MKKKIILLISLCMTALLLTGCGGKEEETPEITAAEAFGGIAQETIEAPIDVDLTKLSSTMVYSEVYNMMVTPEDYVGRTVKMNGQFAIYQSVDENGEVVSDQIYYACVIADATACCQQGIEFVPEGDLVYPDDFPEVGDEITVTGEFRTYMEGETQFCHLVGAVMEN